MVKQNRKSRRGREPSLTVRHSLRVTPDEMALIDAVRDRVQEIFPRRKISRSQIIRMMIVETGDAMAELLSSAPVKVGKSEVIERYAAAMDTLQGADYQLQRVGVNLNQIAKHMNSGQFKREDIASFSELQKELSVIRFRLDSIETGVFESGIYPEVWR